MIKLRTYQNDIIDKIQDKFKNNITSLLIQAPTGAGKTIIFTELARRVSLKNKKVLLLTNRVELLLQAGGAFEKVGLEPFYIEAGCNVVSSDFNCYIAMSQTLRRRMKLKYWQDFLRSIDLLIIDEAHLQDFNWYFEGNIKAPYLLGFTATPKRSGNMRQLGLDYEDIITTVSVADLIEQGYLVNDDYYGFLSPNIDNVEIDRAKGDYKTSALFRKYDTPVLYRGVIENYQSIADGTKTLVFCVNIEHTIKTVKEFAERGYDVKFLTSSVSKPTPPKGDSFSKLVRYEEKLRVYNLYKQAFSKWSGERKDVLRWFKETKGAILVNASILTTGFDEPSIETIIVYRATVSVSLWLQIIGRGSRIFNGKTSFIILDFGANAQRLGYYTEERTWSLWHTEVDGKGIPPVKECGFDSEGKQIMGNKKGCRRLILASYKICPFCGFKYPEKKLQEITLTGIAFDVTLNKAIKTKKVKDMNFSELYEYWKMKKHKTSWLWRQLWYKGREQAIIDFGDKYHWQYQTKKKAIMYCKNMN